ncbi:putative DNA-binding transcriptional regulator YafY [Maritalea mobilis]|uniref:Putative DNA-binding transcriptional regulator YafY n=1 Tax=Maritalea mobilis TaxID=483324 RepID=A0A4R6VKR8_9HYPH|nr:YafY family protein [Maritalea mobilis]TDQ64259.1 putative DNA-binding transcriptional regulator YafY [Maritalea mobilis]
MRRAERLFRIIQIMRTANGALTAQQIAEKLEISKRSVYRDMAHLIGSGAPIDSEPGVGFMLRGEFDLPPLSFTFEQLEALALGAKTLALIADKDMSAAAKEALAKIRDAVPQGHQEKLDSPHLMVVPPQGITMPQKELRQVRKAIDENRILSVTYRALDDKVSERQLYPLALTNFGPIWLMTAWCVTRQDFRDFRMDRFDDMQVQREKFTLAPHQTLEAYLKRFEG